MKVLIGLAMVVLIGGSGWYLYNNNQNQTHKTPIVNVGTSASDTKTTSSAEIVTTKSDSTLGQYLADVSGMPLYTYEEDTSGVSNCSGTCLASWPAYAANDSATLPSNVTIIKRTDGTSQYAYKGLPLYTFTSDSAGKVTGDGVAKFHLVKP